MNSTCLDIDEKEGEISGRTISSSSSSSDDPDRRPLLWNSKTKKLLENWQQDCMDSGKIHESKAKCKKKIYYSLMIPSIIFPCITSTYQCVLLDRPFITMSFLAATAILTTLNGFLHLGSLTERHFQAEKFYHDIYDDISIELAKPSSDRQNCDVYIEYIRGRIRELNGSSPDI